jgi:hypothetical protein
MLALQIASFSDVFDLAIGWELSLSLVAALVPARSAPATLPVRGDLEPVERSARGPRSLMSGVADGVREGVGIARFFAPSGPPCRC